MIRINVISKDVLKVLRVRRTAEAWAKANPERIKELGRRWYARTHPNMRPKRTLEERKKRMSDWHRANYLAKHPDAVDRRALRLDGLTAKQRCARKPESRLMARIRSHNRRARVNAAGGSFTAEQFKALGNRCLCCGHTEAELAYEGLLLVPDHVIPIALGGSSDISNIQPLCHSNKRGTVGGCNNHKGTQTTDYRGALWPDHLSRLPYKMPRATMRPTQNASTRPSPLTTAR